MAQQEEGWPLGLRLLNARIGMVRNGDISGSVSFTTMLTSSTTPSIDSSSDLDTQESTGTFFRDRSITLGSLIGISSFLTLSRRSATTTMEEPSSSNNKKKNHHKLMKPYWLFSLCSKLNTDAVILHSDADAPSLGQYLEAERRAAAAAATSNNQRRNQCQEMYVPNDFDTIQDSNSLFHGEQVAVLSPDSMDEEEEANREWEQSNNRFGATIIFPCLCG
ncbi:hypothetical protein HN51_022468 [Arachis hypogaea]|uniref:Uncharacterized protein LOC107474939 n=2 Tax=Arachis TaxID=3817 RepID=A0A6P4CFB2_ARADU|nr:uncharacterized protein LOC107474939 [Arachis duranensis]XP_025651772.1 uncharacterized protein LOC112747797 [Arachis hypogaea]XP_025651779.1 uncharacterized protein LOC112747797 [Arachis hypogaea]XP_029148265.1 uncharacterized protein LOC112747797 [Arachis hypogaea]XP_052113340.1 uncharacterized protein LOC107474939 [Arachis duranensis]XP_052113341.1 uncharacterized protein LOC107474939 [Arachis duranensis]QHO53705.1 uncharacterized protein DS421_2g50310 [Arachis hypogaea]RYR73076.1 hypo